VDIVIFSVLVHGVEMAKIVGRVGRGDSAGLGKLPARFPDGVLEAMKIADLFGDKAKIGEIPCKFLEVQQVNKDNLKKLVVNSGFQTYEGVCDGVEDRR
jgi:hypothetical protein